MALAGIVIPFLKFPAAHSPWVTSTLGTLAVILARPEIRTKRGSMILRATFSILFFLAACLQIVNKTSGVYTPVVAIALVMAALGLMSPEIKKGLARL